MFEGIRSRLRERYYRYEFRTSSVPTLSGSAVTSDLAIFCLVGIVSAMLIFYGFFVPSRKVASAPSPAIETYVPPENINSRQATPKVIIFRPMNYRVPVVNYNDSKPPAVLSSNGSVVGVRLLNSVEVYDTVVPALVQITDYGLGKEFLGKTLIGDATPMSHVGRMRIDFNTLRINSHTSIPIAGQALSSDGSYGIVAQKKEGLIDRGVLGTVHEGLSGPLEQRRVGFMGGGFSMESMLVGAMLRGLQEQFRSDVSVDYNRSVVLTLKSGKTFVVQLVDDLQKER